MADSKISALTSYTTPLNADLVPIVDTANTTTKQVSWTNIKATLKAYFDTLYGAVTTVSVTTANGVSGSVATATTTPAITITLGAITPTTVNGNTFTTGSSTYTGTAAQTYTFPSTTATIARTDAAQTFTGVQTTSLVNTTPQTLTVASNAATADITHGIQNFTNSSAATMTITLTTTSAVDGQFKEVRIYDFSGVAQSITWVNTENSTVTAPATSNGSTTLPLSALFQFNGSTSKWRCIATA